MKSCLEDERIPVWFSVSEVFTPIPLGQDPADRVEQAIALAEERFPWASRSQVAEFAISQEVAISRMLGEGVKYAATGVFKVEDEGENPRISTGQLCAIVKHNQSDRRYSLRDIQKEISLPGRQRSSGVFPIPAGESLIVAEATRVQGPANLIGLEEQSERVVHQFQAIIPFPGGERTLVLAMSTEYVQDSVHYQEALANVVGTVRFDSGSTPSSSGIEDRLAGL